MLLETKNSNGMCMDIGENTTFIFSEERLVNKLFLRHKLKNVNDQIQYSILNHLLVMWYVFV